MNKVTLTATTVTALLMLTSACGKSNSSSGSGAGYPLLAPPVQAATPSGLSGSTAAVAFEPRNLFQQGAPHDRSLDIGNFQSRFFTSGPTNLFGILSDVDSRISGLNSQTASSTSACVTQAPVAVAFTIFGQTVTLQLQCYSQLTSGFTGDPALIEWGRDSAGVFYLVEEIGAGWTIAIATPLASGTTAVAGGGNTAANYVVNAWSSVGVGNGTTSNSSTMNDGTCGTAGQFDSCSYAVIQIHADPSKPSLEMTVAGLGIGFSGAQILTDGTDIFGEGDEGSGTDTICVLATSLSTPVSSCTVSASNFTLPPLGIVAGSGPAHGAFAASAYPGTSGVTVAGVLVVDSITLNGTSTDSVHFGTTTPSAGVGQF